MTKFIVNGGVPLRGKIQASGSKNAALPILAGTLLTNEVCEIKNVPDIADARTMLELLKLLGSEFSFEKDTVKIQTKKLRFKKLPWDLTCKMRASVLLLGPLLARLGRAEIPLPGGCVLGRRSFDTHIDAFCQLGARNLSSSEILKLKMPGRSGISKVILREMSVTATENILMALALKPQKSEIHLAAMEPHVQDLCGFLRKMGVKISGIGTPYLKIQGQAKLRGVKHDVMPDYLETGTFALAAALTKGKIEIQKCAPLHLTAFWKLLREAGVKFSLSKNSVSIFSSKKLKAVKRLKTAPYPGFPTDLQAPFAVLLTQCKGVSKIHETLFDARLYYLQELEKMGAKIKIANTHEAFVTGCAKLHGRKIESHDIRAGAAMILAALTAKGRSEVSHIEYLDRGYERMDEKLRRLGARIERRWGANSKF